MKRRCIFIILIIAITCYGITGQDIKEKVFHVETGLDVLLNNNFNSLRGKKVGIITNHTGLAKNGKHIADLIHSDPNVTLVALFGPEHGIRGSQQGGVEIDSNIDSSTAVPVYSLYTDTRKPTAKMLADLDIMIFDIQDVGARFYTYISTMAMAMESAALNHKTFVVLDRPNPITGEHVEGPMLKEGYESFVGLYKIPVRHGMTVAELALMFKGEGWVAGADSLDLQVVRMTGWQRPAWLDETDVPWIAPSPNMRTLQTAIVYPGLCLVEGTNISEGRGTDKPFEKIGAPWIDGEKLAETMNACNLPGVTFEPVSFKPQASPDIKWLKYRDMHCSGVFIKVSDRNIFQPVRSGVTLIWTIQQMYPEKFDWSRSIDRLYGSDQLRTIVDSGGSLEKLLNGQQDGLQDFLQTRKKYLLYPE